MHDGMSALRELETLTRSALPPAYCQLLADYPTALLNLPRAEDGTDEKGQVSTVQLLRDPADVLDINQEVRSGSVMDPAGDEFHWPNRVLVIGETGEGDYYGIDLTGEYEGVLFFDHQPVEFTEVTDSLDEFVDLLLETFAA